MERPSAAVRHVRSAIQRGVQDGGYTSLISRSEVTGRPRITREGRVVAQDIFSHEVSDLSLDQLRASAGAMRKELRNHLKTIRKGLNVQVREDASKNGEKLSTVDRTQRVKERYENNERVVRALAERKILTSVLQRARAAEMKKRQPQTETIVSIPGKRYAEADIEDFIHRVELDEEERNAAVAAATPTFEPTLPVTPYTDEGQQEESQLVAIDLDPNSYSWVERYPDERFERFKRRRTRLDDAEERSRRGNKKKGSRVPAFFAAAIGGLSLVFGFAKTAQPTQAEVATALATPGIVATASQDVMQRIFGEVGQAYNVSVAPKEPSVDEKLAVSFTETYRDAKNNGCFQVVRLTSKETGKSVRDVVVFNDKGLTPAQFEAMCRVVFPRTNITSDNPRFEQFSSLHNSNLLANSEIAKKQEQLVFVGSAKNGYVGFRQLDETCNLVGDATIIANIMEDHGYAALSPITISEMMTYIDRERNTILGHAAQPARAASLQRGIRADMSHFNIFADEYLKNKQFADALGLVYRLEPIEKSIQFDSRGVKLDRAHANTTTHDQAFWINAGHKLAQQYIDIIKRGGHPKYSAQVGAPYSHTMPVVAVEPGDETKPSVLYVHESADFNQDPGWEYVKGKWKLVRGSNGIVKIVLDEYNLRLMNQVEDNESISVWYWKGNPTVAYRWGQQVADQGHNQADAQQREARGVRI